MVISFLYVAPVATCQAMARIERMLEEDYNCSLSTDCLELTCSDGSLFQLILLPCFSPPAVRVVFSGAGSLDYIYQQSETDALKGTQHRVNVTLEHLNNGAIGLQASPNTNNVILNDCILRSSLPPSSYPLTSLCRFHLSCKIVSLVSIQNPSSPTQQFLWTPPLALCTAAHAKP